MDIQIIECVLLIDLLSSGIPLGILTALELFYFTEENTGLDSQKIWELVKLAALGGMLLPRIADSLVDLIGASFLIYFGIFGLGPKHKHEHENEKKPLLSNSSTV